MSADPASDSAKPAARFVSLAALLTIAIGILVLIGWLADIAVLKSILPVWVSMKANTAVCFVLTGSALFLLARPAALFPPSSIYPARLARFCGALAGLIALLTLAEYLFDWNIGIDQWLIREAAGTVGTSHPGRMAPETALSFVLLSSAIWQASRAHKTRCSILASVIPALLVATFALSALMSYLTPGLGAYGWFGLTIMAVHTAILFGMLGVGLILVSWQPEVLSWSLTPRTTTAFACAMALLVFIGLNTNRSQFWLQETNRQIAYNEEVQGDFADILIEVIDAQAHTRGYMITGDERFKTHFLEASASSRAKLEMLRRLVAVHPHQQQVLDLIETRVNAELDWLARSINTERISQVERSAMVIHGEGLLNDMRDAFEQIESAHHQQVLTLKQDAENLSRFAYLVISIGALASLLILLITVLRLNDSENKRAQKEQALKKNEEALRESNERFELAVKGTNDGIWDWDITSNANYFSPRFMELLGYAPGELMNELQSFESLLHPEDRSWVFERVRLHLEDKAPYNVEYRLRTKQGDYKWFQARGAAIRDASGKPIRMAGSITDISERRQIETAMNALIETSAAHTGTKFFSETVKSLCIWLGMDCAILSELAEGAQAHALAMYLDGQSVEHYQYGLTGTPCENAVQKGYCAYQKGVVQLFPNDKDLADLRAEAYIGTSILDNEGKVIGILCVLSRHLFVPPPMMQEVFKIIAARAGTEIERKHAEDKIREQLDYLERFRKVAVKREFRIRELTEATEKLQARIADLEHTSR